MFFNDQENPESHENVAPTFGAPRSGDLDSEPPPPPDKPPQVHQAQEGPPPADFRPIPRSVAEEAQRAPQGPAPDLDLPAPNNQPSPAEVHTPAPVVHSPAAIVQPPAPEVIHSPAPVVQTPALEPATTHPSASPAPNAAVHGSPLNTMQFPDAQPVALPPSSVPVTPISPPAVAREDDENSTAVEYAPALSPAHGALPKGRGHDHSEPVLIAPPFPAIQRPEQDQPPVATESHDPTSQPEWYRRIKNAAAAPGWPPLPTMATGTPDASQGIAVSHESGGSSLKGAPLHLSPRDGPNSIATEKESPADIPPQNVEQSDQEPSALLPPAAQQPTEPSGHPTIPANPERESFVPPSSLPVRDSPERNPALPAGAYFDCPSCCGRLMTSLNNQNATASQCPYCAINIVPPHVLPAPIFKVAIPEVSSEEPETQRLNPDTRPDRSKAKFHFHRGSVRESKGLRPDFGGQ